MLSAPRASKLLNRTFPGIEQGPLPKSPPIPQPRNQHPESESGHCPEGGAHQPWGPNDKACLRFAGCSGQARSWPPYLPEHEADGIDHGRLDDLSPREDAPGDCVGLQLRGIGDVFTLRAGGGRGQSRPGLDTAVLSRPGNSQGWGWGVGVEQGFAPSPPLPLLAQQLHERPKGWGLGTSFLLPVLQAPHPPHHIPHIRWLLLAYSVICPHVSAQPGHSATRIATVALHSSLTWSCYPYHCPL